MVKNTAQSTGNVPTHEDRHSAARGRVRGSLAGAASDGADGGGHRPRLGVGWRPPALPLAGSPVSRPVGGLDDARRVSRCDRADRAGTAGGGDQLPQPGDDRQEGGNHRGGQRWPADSWPRCRLEPDRIRRLRLSVRPSGQPLRGGVHHHPQPAARWAMRLRRPLLPAAPLRARAAWPTSRRPAADGRLGGRADAVDHAAPRAGLERVVRVVREQRRALSGAAGPDRCRLSRSRPRSCRGGAHGRAVRGHARCRRQARGRPQRTGQPAAPRRTRTAGCDPAFVCGRGRCPRAARARPDHSRQRPALAPALALLDD